MSIELVAYLGLILATSVCLIVALLAFWHTPRELRGDWWHRFERDFRSYADQTSTRH